MRNLLRLLGRYHVLLLFLAAQGFALSWYASGHGYPRGKWVRASLAITGAWDARLAEIASLAELREQNDQLLAENARLRAGEGLTNGWQVQPARVIRLTTDLSHNLMVLEKLDSTLRWSENQGILAGGFAAGRILDIRGPYAIGVPIASTGMEWSGRVRHDGPVGRVRWTAGDPARCQMFDVPRSTSVFPGDTLFTTGLQGIFPPDVPLGTVVDQSSENGDEFITLEFNFLADFRSIRYVECVERPNAHLIDSLLNAFNDMQWTD